MNKIPFSEFVAEKGQTEAGRLLGASQGAICKALKQEREIYVTVNDDGSFSAEELRPFPAQKRDPDLNTETGEAAA